MHKETEQITKEDNYLVIKIPLTEERFCPFTEKSKGFYPSIAGFVDKEKKEIGFCYRIDRSYKGKDDDFSSPFFNYWGEKKDFKKVCKNLGIDIVYYQNLTNLKNYGILQ